MTKEYYSNDFSALKKLFYLKNMSDTISEETLLNERALYSYNNTKRAISITSLLVRSHTFITTLSHVEEEIFSSIYGEKKLLNISNNTGKISIYFTPVRQRTIIDRLVEAPR